MELRIPKRFYDDHRDRDLPAGDVVRETSRHYVIQVTEEEADEILDDARYYDSVSDLRRDYPGLCSSARATIKAIEHQWPEAPPARY